MKDEILPIPGDHNGEKIRVFQEDFRLSDLVIDSALQVRIRTRPEIVEQYASRMRAGDVFPPLVVFKVGETHILVDGWHRCAAAKDTGFDTCSAEVRIGTREDALIFALGANSQHGLPLSNADKRHAVEVALKGLAGRSDRYIADKLKVSPTFVGRIRKQLSTLDSSSRIGADGKSRKLPSKHHNVARGDSSAEECWANTGSEPVQAFNRIKGVIETELSASDSAAQRQIIAETQAYLRQIESRVTQEADGGTPAQQEAKEERSTVSGKPESAPARLSFVAVIVRVLSAGGRPMSLEEICEAAQSLLPLTGTQGKTPLASLKSKLYLSAKAGNIIKEGNRFRLAEECRES